MIAHYDTRVIIIVWVLLTLILRNDDKVRFHKLAGTRVTHAQYI